MAVVAVLNGMAVLYLADDAPQRIALEHRFAMWVAGRLTRVRCQC